MKQSPRSNRNICDGNLTESEFWWYERYRAEKKENIHLIQFRKRRRKRRRREKQPSSAAWLDRIKQEFDDEELAEFYEESKRTNDNARCSVEDASTYEYLESYWYKQD